MKSNDRPFTRFWIEKADRISFLYRPLYYNLIDEKFGRRVGLLIFPYVILLLTLVSMRVDAFKYFPSSASSQEINHAHYLDITGEKEMIDEISIPSKIITSDFLELFIPYLEKYDDEIELLCPGIKPDKNLGIKFDIFRIGRDTKPTSTDSLLICVSQLHQLFINDSLYTSPTFHFYKHPRNDEHGLLSLVDIHHLEKGRHKLEVFTARKLKNTSIGDSIAYHKNVAFPFWKE